MSIVTFRIENDVKQGRSELHAIPTSTVRIARTEAFDFPQKFRLIVDTSEGVTHEIDVTDMTSEQRLQAVTDLDHDSAPDEIDVSWLFRIEPVDDTPGVVKVPWRRTAGTRMPSSQHR